MIKVIINGNHITQWILYEWVIEGTNPNWYYYWEQTSANYGTHGYAEDEWQCRTQFDTGSSSWKSYIKYGGDETSGAGTWSSASGIDFYANLCRHEERHRLDMIALWGASTNRTEAQDPDGDWLPTNSEAGLGSAYHTGAYDMAICVAQRLRSSTQRKEIKDAVESLIKQAEIQIPKRAVN